MWRRIVALVRKELLAALRDPRGRMVLIGPPIMQLFLFTYAATLEVKNIDIAVLNEDSGRWGAEFVQRLRGSPTFREIKMLTGLQQAHNAIDNREGVAVIHIGPQFSRNVEAGKSSAIQVILDGRRSNATQIMLGYINQIATGMSSSAFVSASSGRSPAEAVVVRHWFNPNLEFIWFIVPSLIGTITLLVAMTVTGQSVARERELGTFDQLMVSPLRTHEILLGKMVPPLIIGMFHTTVYILAAVFVFGVPFRGNVALVYLSVLLYLSSVVGVGLFISSMARTQQQAFLGSFFFISPAILLSGFATPIENMPEWLQTCTLANPLRHFLVIVRGIFLKGMPANEVAWNALPLIPIAIFTLTIAAWLFRKRME